uniref:MOSC_N domain-containing protein n=1 Tax=Heterorhabditis bacteriophora TaxID=37862 RepID=A0A1I7XDT8_HETBA
MISYVFLLAALVFLIFPIIFYLRKRWPDKVGRFHLVSSEASPVAVKFAEVHFHEGDNATVRLKQCEYTGPHDVVVVGGNNIGSARLLDTAFILEWDDNSSTSCFSRMGIQSSTPLKNCLAPNSMNAM